MDKITCIAFIMYHSSEDQIIKKLAIQILKGDLSVREACSNPIYNPHIANAEQQYKKGKPNKLDVQAFAEEFLLVEV